MYELFAGESVWLLMYRKRSGKIQYPESLILNGWISFGCRPDPPCLTASPQCRLVVSQETRNSNSECRKTGAGFFKVRIAKVLYKVDRWPLSSIVGPHISQHQSEKLLEKAQNEKGQRSWRFPQKRVE